MRRNAWDRVFGHIPVLKHKTPDISSSGAIAVQVVHSKVPVTAEREKDEEDQ